MPAVNSQYNNEARFLYLKKRPYIAWPTVFLLAACLLLIATSWALVLSAHIPLWLGCILNCTAYYYLFAPLHDGLHRALSTNPIINEVIATIPMLVIVGMPSGVGFARMFHTQHHIQCGHPQLDPDLEISSNPKNAFSTWFIWGSQYFAYYEKYKESIPALSFRYIRLQMALVLILASTGLYFFPLQLLFLWIVPVLFMAWMIALVFSYLPHHAHKHVPSEDSMSLYQTTCNRIGWEWLLTPLMQYQNYHLAHHLYPLVPFYRYRSIWNARLKQHEEYKPAEVHAFSNKPTYY